MTDTYSGTGAGAITGDGCSVEVYRRLPYFGELEGIRGEFSAGVSVLELGCAAGRLTRRLLELGARPTCVDFSSEMLASLPGGVEAILGDIRAVRLSRTFDRVLLASGFINHSSDDFVHKVLETCALHTNENGRLIVERFDADWLLRATEGRLGRAGPLDMFVAKIAREGARVAITTRYVEGESEWSHSASVLALREAEVEALLARHGYQTFVWDARRRWLSAGFR